MQTSPNVVNNPKGFDMINNQQVVGGFLKAILATERQIPYNPKFMDHELRLSENRISFMSIVNDPVRRIILSPGDRAITRATHPHPRHADTSNIILMQGTQYGLVVVFGREKSYDQCRITGKFIGDLPKLHAGTAFTMAMLRHFKHIGNPISLIGSEVVALEWLFSDSFTKDIAEQAARDKAAGVAVGDGLPPKAPSSYLVKANRAATPSAKTARHSAPTVKLPPPHPMDIMPCRANNFKGRPATEQEKVDYAERVRTDKPIGEIEVRAASKQEKAENYVPLPVIEGVNMTAEYCDHQGL